MIRCPSCAAGNPDGSRFCNQCGARVAEAAPQPRPGYTPRHLAERILKDRAAMAGERKRVTVLFADIKGSTRLAQQAGAEGWHGILDRFFSILAEAVHRYEGTVNQYTGDGIMALFGAPVAHEDHAQRACLAALDMQAQVRRFADALRLERGLNLSMRVGLNTGEVIVGRIGDDLRMDYTAQGLTVNLAARLEHICEPGRVLASKQTAALVEGSFRMRSLGETTVDGHDAPIEVFDLEGRSERGTALEWRLARGGSSFVGRGKALAGLHVALAAASGGQGRVVGIVGGAGIGKSRLCHEFLAAVTAQGIPIHRAAGLPYARSQPMLAPQLLARSRIGLDSHAPAATARRLLDARFPLAATMRPGTQAFIHDFFGVGEPGALKPDVALALREPMMGKLEDLLLGVAEPQVLLIEDLHFLDEATLEFLLRLGAAVAKSPTLLLLSWRDDAAPALLPALDERIALAPLEDGDVSRLAAEWLGEDPSFAPLIAQIAERAGGNPFFVEEAITALAETGRIEGVRGAYRLVGRAGRLPIPDTVHALIAARIDRLPAEHKAALHGASVIGSEFDAALLTEMGEPEADAAVGALECAGLLRSVDGPAKRYAFVQPLVREVAYGTQLESHRTATHARLAQVLERGGAAAGRSIAQHWAAAGEWERAGQWRLEAATWLSTRDARATVEQFLLAIEHLDRAPATEAVRRLRVLARSGLIRMAQFWNLPPARIEAAYAEARQLADELADPLTAAELMISYANEQLHRGFAVRSVELVRGAFDQCPEAARATFANRFRLATLMTHNAVGRIQDAIDLTSALGGEDWLTRPIDAENHMSRAFLVLRLLWAGRLREAASDLADAIAIAEREGRSASWMHAFRVDLAWFTGEPVGALEAARHALAQAEAFGSQFFRAIALRAWGEALCLAGRHEEALAPLLEGRPLAASDAGGAQIEANHLAVLCEAFHGAGRTADAARTGRAAVESAVRSGSSPWELRAWVARLSLPPGVLSPEEAETGFARAYALADLTGAEGLRPRMDELSAAWAPDDASRAALLLQAREGYERIGAEGYAARLRAAEGLSAR